jgi:hypothetical protein
MAKYTQIFCVSILVIYFLYITSNTYRIQRGHIRDVPVDVAGDVPLHKGRGWQ